MSGEVRIIGVVSVRSTGELETSGRKLTAAVFGFSDIGKRGALVPAEVGLEMGVTRHVEHCRVSSPTQHQLKPIITFQVYKAILYPL